MLSGLVAVSLSEELALELALVHEGFVSEWLIVRYPVLFNVKLNLLEARLDLGLRLGEEHSLDEEASSVEACVGVLVVVLKNLVEGCLRDFEAGHLALPLAE